MNLRTGTAQLEQAANVDAPARSKAAFNTGFEDARLGVSEAEGQRHLSAQKDALLANFTAAHSKEKALARAEWSQVAQLETCLKGELNAFAGRVMPMFTATFTGIGLVALLVTDVIVLKEATNVLGIGVSIHQWLAAFATAILLVVVAESLNSRSDLSGRLSGSKWFLGIVGASVVVLTVAVAGLRVLNNEATLADTPGILADIWKQHGAFFWTTLALYNLVMGAAFIMATERIELSLRTTRLRRKANDVTKRREDLDRELVLLDELLRVGVARIEHLEPALQASYLRGRLAWHRSEDQKNHWAVVAGIGALCLAVIVGMSAEFIRERGLGVLWLVPVVCVFGVSLHLCKGAISRLRLANKGKVAGVLGLTCISILLPSCAPAPTPPTVVLVVDVSRSVSASDEDIATAVLSVLGRLPRCAEISVVPVNARAGSIISARLPCDAISFDDDLRLLYGRTRQTLVTHLPAWRMNDNWSDYYGTFRLAEQILERSKHGHLVVLGDFLDDRPRLGRKLGRPTVPSMGWRLSGVNVYLGFLESRIIDALDDFDRLQFEELWRQAFRKSGASSVELRPYGQAGLNEWTERMFGPPRPVFERWRQSTLSQR